MQATIERGSWQKQWGMLLVEVWSDVKISSNA